MLRVVFIEGVRVDFEEDSVVLSSTQHQGGPVRFKHEGIRTLLSMLYDTYGSRPDNRRSFRVPVRGEDFDAVELRAGARTFQAIPIDISMTGMLVELQGTPHVVVPIGAIVELRLVRRDAELVLRSEIRRRDGSNYGILFRDSFQGEDLDPPTLLSQWVMEIQHERVRNKHEKPEVQ